MITLFVILSTVPFLALTVWFYLKAAPRLDAMAAAATEGADEPVSPLLL